MRVGCGEAAIEGDRCKRERGGGAAAAAAVASVSSSKASCDLPATSRLARLLGGRAGRLPTTTQAKAHRGSAFAQEAVTGLHRTPTVFSFPHYGIFLFTAAFGG